MSEPILVPLDGSGFAEHALPHALAACLPGTTLHLLLVHRSLELWDAARPAHIDNRLETAIREREIAYIGDLADRLRAAGHTVETALMDGDVAGSIAAYARLHDIGMIALTSHARGGFERAWLGSVADAVIRSAAAPVLVVRPDDTMRDPLTPAPRATTVLAAWDGSEEARHALDYGANLAARWGAELIVMRVVTPYIGPASPYLPHAAGYDQEVLETRTDAARRDLDSVAVELTDSASTALRVRTTVEVHTSAARGILELAKATDAGLIVMGSHGRGAAGRAVLGSVSDKVVRGTIAPVLVCRKPRV